MNNAERRRRLHSVLKTSCSGLQFRARVDRIAVLPFGHMKLIASLTRILPGILAGLAAVVVAGCVSAHLVHQDPGFTIDALKKGAIVVGGVAFPSTGEEIDERQTASAIDHLEREIKSRRPELQLKKHARFKSALGATTLENLLNAVGSDSPLEPNMLAPAKANGTDFVVFIVVSYNTVDRYVTNHTDVRNVYDENREVTGHEVKYHTVSQAKRSVSAEYRFYDAADGKRVWASKSSNSRSRSRTADSGDAYPPAPDYGPAPTVSRVLQSMTSAVVKELPAPESPPAPTSETAPAAKEEVIRKEF